MRSLAATMEHMNTDDYTLDQGFLKTPDGHEIYWQDWGNKDAEHPVLFLHGGPGDGCKDRHKLFFDPAHHRVIFHDQRGSGKSTPFGSLRHNTTDHLVQDIALLKRHRGITGKISLFGGSWGSALAFAAAIANPQNVHKMLLSGIYLGTKAETDYIQQGGVALYFPESWQQYADQVPVAQQSDTVGYYMTKMQSSDPAVADEHTRRWIRNEAAMMHLDPDWSKLQQDTSELTDADRNSALIEAHYFKYDCFMPDGFIMDNTDVLAEIPIVMVQGRYDHVCPPATAYNLAKKLGKKCHLQIVNANHAIEGSSKAVLRAYAWAWL